MTKQLFKSTKRLNTKKVKLFEQKKKSLNSKRKLSKYIRELQQDDEDFVAQLLGLKKIGSDSYFWTNVKESDLVGMTKEEFEDKFLEKLASENDYLAGLLGNKKPNCSKANEDFVNWFCDLCYDCVYGLLQYSEKNGITAEEIGSWGKIPLAVNLSVDGNTVGLSLPFVTYFSYDKERNTVKCENEFDIDFIYDMYMDFKSKNKIEGEPSWKRIDRKEPA